MQKPSKATLIARIIFGFVFFGAGIAGLFNLAPPPANLPEKMQTFMNGMMATGYFFQLLKGTEVVCGFLIMVGLYVPLALVILAPVVLNIFCVHLFMDRSGLPLALVLGVLEIYLAFFALPYRTPIRAIFQRKA